MAIAVGTNNNGTLELKYSYKLHPHSELRRMGVSGRNPKNRINKCNVIENKKKNTVSSMVSISDSYGNHIDKLHL